MEIIIIILIKRSSHSWVPTQFEHSKAKCTLTQGTILRESRSRKHFRKERTRNKLQYQTRKGGNGEKEGVWERIKIKAFENRVRIRWEEEKREERRKNEDRGTEKVHIRAVTWLLGIANWLWERKMFNLLCLSSKRVFLLLFFFKATHISWIYAHTHTHTNTCARTKNWA